VDALGVLDHDVLEERGDLVLAGVLGVADVLAVAVPGLQPVVLQEDEVEGDVIETGFSCGDVSASSLEPPSERPRTLRRFSRVDSVSATQFRKCSPALPCRTT